MKPGFLETTLDTRSANGRDDVLLSELHFRDINGTVYRVPIGAETDGGSTPRLVWLIPGFEPFGDHWLAWVLHDSAYRGTLLFRAGPEYLPWHLSRLQADQLLDRALATKGMSPAKRAMVYHSLRATGWRYYRKP